MKLKVRKPIFAILIMVLVLGILIPVTFYACSVSMNKRIQARNKKKAESVTKTVRLLETSITETIETINKKSIAASSLLASALSSYIEDGSYNGPLFSEYGFILQAEGDRILYPDDFLDDAGDDEFFERYTHYTYVTSGQNDGYGALPLNREFLDSEPVMETLFHSDEFGKTQDMVCGTVKKIADDLWFILVTDSMGYEYSVLNQKQVMNLITDLESAYDGYLVMVNANDPDLSLRLTSERLISDFGEIESIQEIGITQDMLEGDLRILVIGDKSYTMDVSRLRFFGQEVYAIVLCNAFDDIVYNLNCVIFSAIITLIFVSALFYWQYWVQVHVRDHPVTQQQKNMYHPVRIRKVTVSVTLVGTVMIFLVMLTYQALGSLYREVDSDEEALTLISSRYLQDKAQQSKYEEDAEEWTLYSAEIIASLAEMDPSFRTKNFMSMAAKMLEAEYVILFDENGEEIVSSNDYIGLNMDSEICKDCSQIKRILLGDRNVILEPQDDEIAEKQTQVFAVRTDMPDSDKYGALLYAIDPDNAWIKNDENDFISYLKTLTTDGNLSLVINKELSQVLYSNDDELVGKRTYQLGMDESTLTETAFDTFTIDNKNYYGPAIIIENLVFMFLTDNIAIQQNTLPLAAAAAGVLLIASAVVSLFMLSPYKTEIYTQIVSVTGSDQKDSILDDSANNMWLKLQKMDEEKESLWQQWKKLVPEKKVSVYVQFFSFLFLLAAVRMMAGTDSWGALAAVNFILRGNWKRGVNLPAFAGIVILVVVFVVFIFCKNLLMGLLSNILDPKGETVCRLVFNLLQYTAILALLFCAFDFCGLDTRTLLASVSIFGLAITFGSRDLVADILAGIFIIFEDDFHVGDIIEVNGFSGIVQEIGVRSTKLIGIGDNIKIIGNQSVKNVLNMSKMNSWYSIDLNVPADQPLAEIEEMLHRELPEIGKQIPDILSGPYYKGVMKLGLSNTLYIIAECRQEDYRDVQRALNHAIYDLFTKGGYKYN